jgi:hypothetical protein
MSASAVGLAICWWRDLANWSTIKRSVIAAALARGLDRLCAESARMPDLFHANKTILLFSGVDVFSAETEPHDSAQ